MKNEKVENTEGQVEGGEIVRVEAPKTFWDEQIQNIHSWLISLAGHALLLLLATTITLASQAIPTTITVEGNVVAPPPEESKVEEVPKPRGLDTRAGEADPTMDRSNITDPVIFAPGFEEGDHNESDTGDPTHHEMKGDSYDYRSYLPGSGGGTKGRAAGTNIAGTSDTIGLGGGGGGGGRYGGRFGGSRNMCVKKSGATGTESAVDHALWWLARHQNEDGSWSCRDFTKNCKGGKICKGPGEENGILGEPTYDVGVTSLALLAFLGRGYTHLSQEIYFDRIANRKYRYGEIVKKAVEWLIRQQNEEGCVGDPKNPKAMYNHSAAALALAEAFGMTGETSFKLPAQKAVDYICASQNREGNDDYKRLGWRYQYRYAKTDPDSGNDTSVMGWCVMALKSADLSGLTTVKEAYGGALEWVKRATNQEKNYRVGYTSSENAGLKVAIQGVNDAWVHHDVLTAIGVLTKLYINHKIDDVMSKQVAILVSEENIPKWDNSNEENKLIDFYHWYYTTYALFQYTGGEKGNPTWDKWCKAVVNALCKNQRGDMKKMSEEGCTDGSWDPGVDRWGFEGGRVYATAINALTLEVFYRYAAVLKQQGR